MYASVVSYFFFFNFKHVIYDVRQHVHRRSERDQRLRSVVLSSRFLKKTIFQIEMLIQEIYFEKNLKT